MNLSYIFSKFIYLKKILFWIGISALLLIAYVILKQQHDVLSPAARSFYKSISSIK